MSANLTETDAFTNSYIGMQESNGKAIVVTTLWRI